MNKCCVDHIPNAETRRAIQEVRDPKLRAKMHSAKSVEEMFAQILKR